MTTRGEDLRLATRSSDLALRQAATVRDRLETRRRSVELVEVETTGDELQDELIHRLGTTGAFVRSLDQKVLDGDLDAAVHSMKDMPTDQPPDLVVAGVLERAPAADVLVTPDGTSLSDLPEGATVGTSSLRRRAQLLVERPDLTMESLRGNVDTRVEKLLAPSLHREHQRRIDAEEQEEEDSGDDADADDESNDAEETPDESPNGADDETPAYERSVDEWFEHRSEIERRALERDPDTKYDAICLAEAGLERSGLLHHLEFERLDSARFVPAPGQGVIAVTALDGPLAESIHDTIDHPPTRVECTVERIILGELGGGCVAPVGIHARLQGEVVTTTARILSRDGTEEVRATRELPVERHGDAAAAFAADLAEEGAADLIEQARRTEPDEPKRE